MNTPIIKSQFFPHSTVVLFSTTKISTMLILITIVQLDIELRYGADHSEPQSFNALRKVCGIARVLLIMSKYTQNDVHRYQLDE